MEQCKVISLTMGNVLFIGTEKECRKYKRTHYDRWSRIVRADGSIAHG